MSAVAGEDLAVVTGRGPEFLTNIEGLRPYVRDADADAVALGERERDPQTADIHAPEIGVVDLAALRAVGSPGHAVRRAIDRLTGRVDGFWIHLDVDVLDSALMPAVDSPQPDGLSYDELREMLDVAAQSPLAVGAEITIFDPDLDANGTIADRLTDALVAGLAGVARRGQ
jgi:arginase